MNFITNALYFFLPSISKLKVEPTYNVDNGNCEAKGGTYNFYLLFIFAIFLLGWQNVIPWWFVFFLTISFFISLILDDSSRKTKIDLSAIPIQSYVYCKLLGKVAQDLWHIYLISLIFFFIAEPLWHSGLGDEFPWTATSSFWLLYSFYFVVRIGFLINYLHIIFFKWETYSISPFKVKKANLATKEKALKHVLWSFFMGNIGLTVRCASQVIILLLFGLIQSGLELDNIDIVASIDRPILFWSAVVALFLPWAFLASRNFAIASYIYYAVHRTLHEIRSLYDPVHRIHHKAVFSTKLDSGTISPAEFAITEYLVPIFKLLPQPIWVLLEIIIAIKGHFPSHNSILSKDNEKNSESNSPEQQAATHHHHYHHRLFNCNYGLEEVWDVKFGTKV